MPPSASSAEIPRDREQDEGGDASVPAVSGASVASGAGEAPYYLARPAFADLATAAAPSLTSRIAQTERDLEGARTERERAGQAEVEALRRRRESLAPVVEKTREAVSQPMPPPPSPVTLPTPPSRGLREFLAPAEGEAPENTISKLIQGIALMATGFTGLARGDATAALASMKGALAGWQEGDKQRADRHFADWKAKTDKIIEEQNDKHRQWRAILDDKRLTIDQQMQMFKLALEGSGLELAEVQAATRNADERSKWITQRQNHLDQLQASTDRLQQSFDIRTMQVQQMEAARRQAHEHFLEGVAQRERMHFDRMALARETLAAKEDKKDDLKPTPVSELKRIEDVVIGRAYIGEMRDLAGRVDLNKIVGGVRPWINQLIQRWGQPNSPQPPEGTRAGQIPTGRFAMSPDELRFLALMQDYADTILRQRSGAAISIQEFNRMLQFVPDQSVTPDTLRERMQLADDIARTKEEIQRQGLESAGYRFPKIHVPKFIRGDEGPQAPLGRMPAPPGRAPNDPLGIRR